MTTVLLLIHLFVTLALIGVVLIQRSEGGGLGVGTSQGMNSFMSGRGTANLLTRATAILATIFMVLSLTLALLNQGTSGTGRSILDVPAGPNGSLMPGSSSGAGPSGQGGGSTGPTSGGAAPSGAGSPSPTGTGGTDATGSATGTNGTGAGGTGTSGTGAGGTGAGSTGSGAAGSTGTGSGSAPSPQGPSVPTN